MRQTLHRLHCHGVGDAAPGHLELALQGLMWLHRREEILRRQRPRQHPLQQQHLRPQARRAAAVAVAVAAAATSPVTALDQINLVEVVEIA